MYGALKPVLSVLSDVLDVNTTKAIISFLVFEAAIDWSHRRKWRLGFAGFFTLGSRARAFFYIFFFSFLRQKKFI
jgi:hypothetical protein